MSTESDTVGLTPGVPDVENDTLEDRLYTVRYDDAGESHLGLKIPSICTERCHSYECIDVRPANVWREGEDGVPQIAYENCFECGSCRWGCPHGNVEWTYPERGIGVSYKYG